MKARFTSHSPYWEGPRPVAATCRTASRGAPIEAPPTNTQLCAYTPHIIAISAAVAAAVEASAIGIVADTMESITLGA